MSFLRVQNRNFARDNIAEFDAIATAAKDLADACNAIMERDGSPGSWERFQEAELAYAKAHLAFYEDRPMVCVIEELTGDLEYARWKDGEQIAIGGAA